MISSLFSFFKHTHTFFYTSSMISINIGVFPRRSMILSTSKANSGANGCCIIWLLCNNFFRCFFLSPNTLTCLSSPPLWYPLLLLCFLVLPWCYPHLRPTWTQTGFRLVDCCVICRSTGIKCPLRLLPTNLSKGSSCHQLARSIVARSFFF